MAGDYSGWMYEYELNVRDRVMIIRAICRYGMGHVVNLETDPSLNVFHLSCMERVGDERVAIGTAAQTSHDPFDRSEHASSRGVIAFHLPKSQSFHAPMLSPPPLFRARNYFSSGRDAQRLVVEPVTP
jgi:hypothetical protein